MTTSDDDPTADRPARQERRPSRPVEDARALMRWLGILVGVLSLGTPIFLAGYNWAQVREVATAQQAFQLTATSEFQRKDVATEQYTALLGRLDDLVRQIERMQTTVDAQSRRAAQ